MLQIGAEGTTFWRRLYTLTWRGRRWRLVWAVPTPSGCMTRGWRGSPQGRVQRPAHVALRGVRGEQEAQLKAHQPDWACGTVDRDTASRVPSGTRLWGDTRAEEETRTEETTEEAETRLPEEAQTLLALRPLGAEAGVVPALKACRRSSRPS